MQHHRDRPCATRFGQAIRDTRRNRGLTQQQLATLLGVSLATVGRVEGGKSPDPRVERALRAWCKDLPPVDEQPSTDTAA